MSDQPRWLDYLDVEELEPDPRNPKLHADAEIDASMERFGYTEAVVLDERTNLLVAGHGRRERILAAKAEGREPPDGIVVDDAGRWLVPVNRGWSSKDDAEAGAYLVASNRLTEKGGWDDTALAGIFRDLADRPVPDLPDFDPFQGLGYDNAEVQALLAGEPSAGAHAEPRDKRASVWEPDPPVARSEPVTVTILPGDSIELLKDLPDNSIDAVVTDPPYGLEFMGKDWDSFRVDDRSARWAGDERSGGAGAGFADNLDADDERAPYSGLPAFGKRRTTSTCRTCGKRDAFRNPHKCDLDGTADWVTIPVDIVPVEMRAFQNWCHLWAVELYRVMKPGAHLLAFGGSRTYHRLASAVEDAGFDIRDSLHWMYGCLTADVEVLTEHGWKLGIDVEIGEQVAQWDPDSGAVELVAVERTYRAPWAGDLVAFRNSDTDQLVTPNHRVLHQLLDHRSVGGRPFHQWSGWRAAEASTITRRSQIRLPLAGRHDGPGIGGTDYAALLGWVWTEGGFDRSGSGVRISQSSVNQRHCDTIAALLDRVGVHKRYDRDREYKGRAYTESTWFFSGELAARVRASLPGKHPTYPLLWAMTAAETEAFLAAALDGDGSRGSIGSWSLEQKDPADRAWFVTLLALCSRRGHDYTRTNRDGGSVSVSQRPETNLTPAKLAHDREWYEGDVWCVGVPSGAFLARRAGKVFITGNSGFPKSLDISKELDKRAGIWRGQAGEKVSENAAMANSNYERTDKGDPVTDAAREWAGWGTALKPAHEPIVLARKPLDGSTADTILKYGTGGLNIDGTRVDTREEPQTQGAYAGSTVGIVGERDGGKVYDLGRWPANILFTHAPGCTEEGCIDGCPAAALDAQSGFSTTPEQVTRGAQRGGQSGLAMLGRQEGVPSYGDEGGASRFFPSFAYGDDDAGMPVFFYVPKASTAERNAGLDGLESRLVADYLEEGDKALSYPKTVGGPNPQPNFHPTVKPVALMRWLVRLVAAPGATVLDPFAGSGSTLVAAVLEGRNAIGCEKTPDYLPILEARIAWAQGVADTVTNGKIETTP